MTLEEAIADLVWMKESEHWERGNHLHEALKLGIEALKFYLDSSHYACGCLLPGETREE